MAGPWRAQITPAVAGYGCVVVALIPLFVGIVVVVMSVVTSTPSAPATPTPPTAHVVRSPVVQRPSAPHAP